MASFHLAVKEIGRSAGRSATAAAAYRAGVEITDERTGLVHDYTRKQGVEHSELMLPTDAPEWAADRERLWNAAELAETRKRSEEQTAELQSLLRKSYAVFCLKKKKQNTCNDDSNKLKQMSSYSNSNFI